MITVPYLRYVTVVQKDGTEKIKTETKYARFLPETLQSSGKVDCEVLYRGIFKVPVYEMNLLVKGQYHRPDFESWGIDDHDILWNRALFTIRISDTRAITEQARLEWNGESMDFLPGTGGHGGPHSGIHVPLKNRLSNEVINFTYSIKLNGSDGVYFVPFGRSTNVDIESNWPDPSFQGGWLPSDRSVTSEGFNANWNIPFLGRNYPQSWLSNSIVEKAISEAVFGVNFITPVDHYRMTTRSLKYEFLFLLLTFGVLWLFEVLAGIRIHSLQYLLVGAGMCLFYLLEISLAEHIGFIAGYMLASAAIIGLISAYSLAILKGYKRGLVITFMTTMLYGYLYILLMNEDYALLFGSIGLFCILATVMFLTRKIDWFDLNQRNGDL